MIYSRAGNLMMLLIYFLFFFFFLYNRVLGFECFVYGIACFLGNRLDDEIVLDGFVIVD